ncbi:MAG: dTDP-4-dehydrorhamnose reductase [Alphaproteobacteria bacterium]|nr:dTDP-4-dehydrorhamnose reductase [Alphaproteobacteria bacterium]
MKTRRALVIGKSGQLARELARHACDSGWLLDFLGREKLDLTQQDSISTGIEAHLKAHADTCCIINAAAYTAVEKAETEPDLAFAINRDAVAQLAETASAFDLPMLHVSTDFVFDGSAAIPYCESDAVAPLNVYGQSKLEGEQALMALNPQHYVLRTAWLFSAFEGNFLTTMLRLGREREQLRVVDDQIGSPTPADALAEALLHLARQAVEPGQRPGWGLYHFAGDTAMSWAGFARAIFATASIDCDVEPVTTEAYGSSVRRPSYSVLDTDRLKNSAGIDPPNFRHALQRALARIAS